MIVGYQKRKPLLKTKNQIKTICIISNGMVEMAYLTQRPSSHHSNGFIHFGMR